MRFAYADPPYPGMAHLYAEEAAADGRIAREVNHPLLLSHLCDEYPDGWVLSTASTTLGYVLSLCPEDVRVCAWVKPWCSFRPGTNPAYTWEPVILRGGRSWKERGGASERTVRDHLAANATRQRGVPGAKPEAFAFWLFGLLGANAEDELHDLFPGSGVIGRCWEGFCGASPTQGLFEEAS